MKSVANLRQYIPKLLGSFLMNSLKLGILRRLVDEIAERNNGWFILFVFPMTFDILTANVNQKHFRKTFYSKFCLLCIKRVKIVNLIHQQLH